MKDMGKWMNMGFDTINEFMNGSRYIYITYSMAYLENPRIVQLDMGIYGKQQFQMEYTLWYILWTSKFNGG